MSTAPKRTPSARLAKARTPGTTPAHRAAYRVMNHPEWTGGIFAHLGDELATIVQQAIDESTRDLAHMLQRLAEKTARANALQHSGGTIEAEDWAELYQLTNEARALLARRERGQ